MIKTGNFLIGMLDEKGMAPKFDANPARHFTEESALAEVRRLPEDQKKFAIVVKVVATFHDL